jgi:IS4 transposase
VLAFAQLAWRESLRDIETCLASFGPKLYRGRWPIELFFKWIKQHLRIKAFYGTSPNAVRIQIWTTIAVYLLATILKKRLHLEACLYTVLQILSLTLFEKMPISQALSQLPPPPSPADTQNHQCLLGS